MSIKMARMAGSLILLVICPVIISACVSAAAPGGVSPSPAPEVLGTTPPFIPPSVTPPPASPSITSPSTTPPPASPEAPATRQDGRPSGSGAGHEEAPQIVNVTSRLDPNNSLISDLRVELDRPARVWVEYYPANDESARLITPLSEMAEANHQLQLMRLRPETAYNYRVFATSADTESPKETGEASNSFPGRFITGPLPPGLAGSYFKRISGQQTYDMTLLDFNDDDFKGLVAIDGNGEVVWYYQHDSLTVAVAQDDSYNLIFGRHDGFKQVEIRPDGTLVREVADTLEDGTVCAPWGRWHHESLVQPDGKVYTLQSEIRDVQFDGEVRQLTGDAIVVWDRKEGTVETLVSLFELLDPKIDRTPASGWMGGNFWRGCNFNRLPTLGEGVEAGVEDWTHANSLWFGSEGNILMSIRHLDQIISISPDLKSVQWRLGGPGSDFSFPNPSDHFYWQHTAKELPNGNILLFDNGNGRPDAESGEYSRALELELDFQTMEARKVWEYRHSPDLFADCCSSVERLANGNSLLVFGSDNTVDFCCRTFTLVEADSGGNPVSVMEIKSPNLGITYRAYPLDSINGEFTDER